MDDGVLLAAGVLDVRLHQRKVEHVGDAQAAASHFVFVSGTNTAGGSADLHASGSIFRGKLDHAVIGKDHLGAIADEKIAINLYACIAQRLHFLEQREWDREQRHCRSRHGSPGEECRRARAEE